MKIISYSAPAKVILSGAHAVVYGKPAIVSSIDLRLKFIIANSMRSHQNGKGNEAILFIMQKVKEYLQKQKIKFEDKTEDKTFDFEIRSEIPIGRGLGSSAALSVAATAALLEFYSGRKFDKEEINNIAYQVEKFFHKNTSGVDVTASCFGGLIYYRKEFEFLKNISSLNFKIPKKIEENLYLIDSGKPKESTGEMVEFVGKSYNQKPQFVEEVLNDIEKTTKRMVVSIIKVDINFFVKTLVDNQVLLEMLGVVSKNAKNLLKNLEVFGVGKVTGGGGKKAGSGYLLFYANKKNDLEKYLKKQNISFYKFHQDFRGLQNEN